MKNRKKSETKATTQNNEDRDVWKLMNDLGYKNIKSRIEVDTTDADRLYSSLSEDNQKKKVVQEVKIDDKKEEFKVNKETYLLPSVQKILFDTKNHLAEIEQVKDEISNINALYFENKSLAMKRKLESNFKLPDINQRKKEYEEDQIKLTEENTKEKEPETFESKKKKSLNIRKANEDYRKLLSKAFLNFNPLIHLANLKILTNIDPEIADEIEKLTTRINHDLKEVTSKNYYTKQYEKILKEKEKLEKERKRKKEAEEQKKSVVSDGNLSTHEKTEKNEKKDKSNSNNKDKATKPNNFVNYSHFSKKKKKKDEVVRKKFPDKELHEKNMLLMKSCLNKIDSAINTANIEKYYHSSDISEKMNLQRQKKMYFPGILRGFDILKEIQENVIIRDLNQQNLEKKRAMTEKNEDYIEYLNTKRQNLLEGIGMVEPNKKE